MSIVKKIRAFVRPHVGPIAVLGFLMSAGCAGAPAGGGPAGPTSSQGAEVWRQSCNRCHVARPARQFTAEQWPVIVNHMRSRAALTRTEAEAVAAFLQEAARGGEGDG